jgi:hypothetical protein
MELDNPTTKKVINVYSDESRHLGLADNYMIIGGIWIDKQYIKEFAGKVKLIKAKHNIPRHWEIKWAKISESKKEYYLDLVRLFFDYEMVNYRAIVIPKDKAEEYNKVGGDFYYKMQYTMLANIIRKTIADYKIFLDYKDSWSDKQSKKMAEYLSNDHHHNGRTFTVQPIRSCESVHLQMADLITGAVGAANNGNANKVRAKQEIIAKIENLAHQKLTDQTPYEVDKFNLFRWHDEGWDK